MTKQEFLVFSLPYKLYVIDDEINETFQVVWYREDSDELLIYDNNDGSIEEYYENLLKPILRPLSDLTKEIEHNGEKFIPALELIKLEEKYNNWKDIAPTIPYDIKIINKPFGKVLKVSKVEHWVIYLSLNEMERAKYYIVSQLIKWKFDIASLIPKGEAIDVNTLEINPYK